VAGWQDLTEQDLLPSRTGGCDEWLRWHREVRESMSDIGLLEPGQVTVAAAVGLHETVRDQDLTAGLSDLAQVEGVRPADLELGSRASEVTRKLRETAGSSAAMQRVRHTAWAASFGQTLLDVRERQGMIQRTPVLVRGETGTGKELIATAIGSAQPGSWKKLGWQRGPFEPLHLGSIPAELVADALFGHEKGAFSGADGDQKGALERCHGGAVFLDEIAELPHQTQVALLRCLQEGKVRRLGARELSDAAPRLISATHEDLDQAVAAGRFRADLLQRIRSVEIVIPPLRDRLNDLGELVEKLLMTETTPASRPSLLARVMDFVRGPASGYRWPGNVRELAAAIRSLSLGIEPRLRTSQARSRVTAVGTPDQVEQPVAALASLAKGRVAMREIKRLYARAMTAEVGTKREAARHLGITRTTLRKLLSETGDA